MSFEEQASELSKEEIVSLLEFKSSYDKILDDFKKSFDEFQQSKERELKAERDINQELERQVAWFKKQLFGRKTERRVIGSDARQLSLGELALEEKPPAKEETVKSYTRKKSPKARIADMPDDTGLRFDSSVPVQEIEVPNPEIAGLSEDAYEVLSEECSYRLAQRPGSYVVLKYKRKTVKIKETKEIITPKAPPAVLERSYADVSILAGILIDKFLYHIPLYRQHQRLQASGIVLSRGTLSHWTERTISLIEAIYYAQFSSVLTSEVLGMDETPIKAGRKEQGKMRTAYFWPIYGDKEEIVFPFSLSRGSDLIKEVLQSFSGTLIADGYTVYDSFSKINNEMTLAQCWVHARRKFVDAEEVEPDLVKEVIKKIQELYAVEDTIKKRELTGTEKLEYRVEHSKPLVDSYFKWLREVFQQNILLPSNPFTQAASYSLKREGELRVFLQNPQVPLDTNHLERGLRPIPMGRKNWLFCWSELGAKHVGIIQSLLQTCKLQKINPYTYLVDVLQRVDSHPAFDVDELTPRIWKTKFAENPLRSDLDTKI